MGAKGAKPQKKNEAELLEEEITLLLSNTHFNRQQIQEWHANFVVSIFTIKSRGCIFTRFIILIERLSKRKIR